MSDELVRDLQAIKAAAEAGDPEAKATLEEMKKSVDLLERREGSSWAKEKHRLKGSDKGIVNRLSRAIATVQAATGNQMSPELAEHYRQAVVKKTRRQKDRIAKKSRKRNRR